MLWFRGKVYGWLCYLIAIIYLYRPESQIQTKILPICSSFHEISTYLVIFHADNRFVMEQKYLVPALGQETRAGRICQRIQQMSQQSPQVSWHLLNDCEHWASEPVSGWFARLAVKTRLIHVFNWLEKKLNDLRRCFLPGLTEVGMTCYKVNTSELSFYVVVRDNSSFRQMVTL